MYDIKSRKGTEASSCCTLFNMYASVGKTVLPSVCTKCWIHSGFPVLNTIVLPRTEYNSVSMVLMVTVIAMVSMILYHSCTHFKRTTSGYNTHVLTADSELHPLFVLHSANVDMNLIMSLDK